MPLVSHGLRGLNLAGEVIIFALVSVHRVLRDVISELLQRVEVISKPIAEYVP